MLKNRREWRNKIVRPREQIKFAGLLILAGTFIYSVLLTGTFISLRFSLAAIGRNYNVEPQMMDEMFTDLASHLGAHLAVVTILMGAIFLFGVTVSHRVFGPAVAFVRHIETLRGGDYGARVKLRATDEFHEIKDALNELASDLQAKHGSPRPETGEDAKGRAS